MSDIVNNVRDGFLSNEISLWYTKLSLIIGVIIYILLIPFYRGHQSFSDVLAAKKVISVIRIVILIEVLILFFLLYFVAALGSPLPHNQLTDYGNGDSWIYGYARPLVGMIVIGFGVFSDMNLFPRIVCILGCFLQIATDALSAFQVNDYYVQMKDHKAPNNYYNLNLMQMYFYRDIVSIGLSFLIALLIFHICFILGFNLTYQNIPFQVIAGGDIDRCEIMRQQRKLRKYAENHIGDELNFDEIPDDIENNVLIRVKYPIDYHLKNRKKYKEGEGMNARLLKLDADALHDMQHIHGDAEKNYQSLINDEPPNNSMVMKSNRLPMSSSEPIEEKEN
jgi:hypothetical protein